VRLLRLLLMVFTVTSLAYCQPVTRDAPYQVRYAANLGAGESYINIINTGLNGAPPNGPGFPNVSTGNICVNVYALDSSEELLGCCSCMVTPGQTVNLGVLRDVLPNTLVPVNSDSFTIKLVGSSANATTCVNNAAIVTPASLLAGGYVAFGTTMHAAQGSSFAMTETAFIPATLSSSELTSLAGRCAFIIGNAGGYGVCSSCRVGALGASKK
jgi:hypothetical protein